VRPPFLSNMYESSRVFSAYYSNNKFFYWAVGPGFYVSRRWRLQCVDKKRFLYPNFGFTSRSKSLPRLLYIAPLALNLFVTLRFLKLLI